MNEIYLDIETIPAERQDVRDFIAKGVTPPATYKLADSIAKWHKEQGPAAIDEAVCKTSFDGAFGRVVCIGYDLHDTGKPETIYGLDEAFILNQFNNALNIIPVNMWSAMTIVGHNVVNFDLRFLWQRYLINGIRPHAIINMSVSAKLWDTTKVYDTMAQFAGYGKTISLDKLCLAFGIEGKGEVSGADVWPMVQAGKLDDVARYCEHDVMITRDVYKRMTFSE
jgi:3'-5' exonuclease